MDMAAYDKYLSGDLNDFKITDDEITKNISELQ